MAFNVKNAEADLLLRELTAVTNESLTDAIIVSLRQRLARERRLRLAGDTLTLEQAIARFAGRPVVDERADDDVLGYDGDGLPA